MAMDGSKHRSSFDDSRHAFRRLAAHSPRLHLLRPASTTSASSSASSIVSHDSQDEIQSCVGRDAPNDDCALNKFIVWAAVKRNTCKKMTSEERRECPLLRCRKRFDDHELMLQHLHTCDWLSHGEYWCYECGKAERFAEVRPNKRCPSHPSKRRKAMTMAKSFFNSLGHRSKSDELIDLDPIEAGYPSISYEDAVSFRSTIPSPIGAELQSNEIHEIDSVELTPLPIIMEDEGEGLDVPPPMPTMTAQQPILSTYTFPVSPPTVHPTELESGKTPGALVNGYTSSLQPPTIAPTSLINDDDDDRGSERPALHLHTTGLEQYRNKVKAAKSRSKYLGPSSSVRSTASTDSTNSTSTTASYAISPVSAWSSGWVRGNEFESTLTSPADDLAPCDPFGSVQEPLDTFDCHFDDQFGVQFDGDMITDSLPLQPMTDLPMPDIMTNSDHTVTPVDVFQASLFPFDTTGISDLSLAPKTDNAVPAIQIHEAVPPLGSVPELYGEMGSMHDSNGQSPALHKDSAPRRADSVRKQQRKKAVALIGNAFQALQLHFAGSLSRLDHLANTPLVDALHRMPPVNVFRTGLDTLTCMLNGSIVTSPSDLICFIHLAYSLSVFVHEGDALLRGTKLFSQAVSYASWLPREERKPYLTIVNLLWKPNTMSNNVVMGLVRSASDASQSRYNKSNKLLDQSYNAINDSLAGVAQLFLDELEYIMVLKLGDSAELASSLYSQDWGGADVAFCKNSPFEHAANQLHQVLLQNYSHKPLFADGLGQLFNRMDESGGLTLRQFELGLVHVGKTTLPPETFAETYAPYIRSQVDHISTQLGIQPTSRSVYYRHGLKLVWSIVEEIRNGQPVKGPENGPASSFDTMDEMFKSMVPQVTGIDLSPVSIHGLSSPYDFDSVVRDTPLDSRTTTAANTECTTAATTPTSPGPAHPNSAAVAGGVKVESDSCCELCGYRPEGDPRWFSGSMAKHKKLQHATSPPKIYACHYPGCTSQYRNRPDNLRQHQLKKGHFVEGDEDIAPRPPKRKKMDS